jgi:Secretion system C-terminal sorting domain
MNIIFLIITLLASSCPAMLGNSVYKARSTDALIHPGVQYNDYDLCAAVLPQNKTGAPNPYTTEEAFLNSDEAESAIKATIDSKINTFALYPNPISRNADITLTYNIDEATNLAIYDMVGKLILDLDLNIKAQRISFNIGNIATGTYKIKIAILL